jgi:hypothetical protein
MIYEMETYDLATRSVGEVEKRFAYAYAARRRHSELAAFWHTEIGPLNQVIAVWPYSSFEERERVRAAAASEPDWPPAIGEFVLGVQSDIMIPLAISPPFSSGKVGPFFEMRTYTYAPGELPTLIRNWERAIERRLQISPVCALWYSELGAVGKLVHIWPYASLDDRMNARAAAAASGVWPPSVKAVKEGGRSEVLLRQESRILMPATFSPVQ